MQTTGIYYIKNKINGKYYIGQSKDIYSRWIHHKTDLRNGMHHNNHLQSAWNKYGEDNFEFSIIEECDKHDLNVREQYWILTYDSFENGYNLDYGGSGCNGFTHTNEQLNKMRRIQHPMIVLQFDDSFNFVKEFIGGVSHIHKELGYTKESILLRCEHSIKKMTPYKGFYWIFKDEYIHPDFNWNDYLFNRTLLLNNRKKKHSKVIYQYDKNMRLLGTWTFNTLKSQKYNINFISKICNKKIQKYYLDCIWCFSDDIFSLEYVSSFTSFNLGTEKRKKKVIQLDPVNKKEIATFESIADACKFCGFTSHANIINAIKRDGCSGGFKWKYA